MGLQFLVKGIVIGFSIAAPVGPIGILCIRRSVSEGRTAGLATGLGAASADAVYGCIAGFGLTAASNFLIGQRFWLGFLGGLFLCYLGLRTFFARRAQEADEVRKVGLSSAFFSTFFLTLTNPMTILSFVAIFAGLGLGASQDFYNATALVLGVFIGSALWWLLLSAGAALFGRRFNPTWMNVLNRVSGVIIFAFGAYSLWSVR